MTRRVALILTILLVATGTNALACGTSRGSRAAKAGRDPILSSYEKARRTLIGGSVTNVQKAANEIATAAHEAEEHAIAERSSDLANARDLTAARQAFAALSDEVIEYHETNGGDRLAVAYCGIEKTSSAARRAHRQSVCRSRQAALRRFCGRRCGADRPFHRPSSLIEGGDPMSRHHMFLCFGFAIAVLLLILL